MATVKMPEKDAIFGKVGQSDGGIGDCTKFLFLAE